MLVLSRKVGQQIRIGKSIVVTLLNVERNKARLGIEAPAGIPVFRQELLDFDRRRPTQPTTSSSNPEAVKPRNDFRPARSSVRGPSTSRYLWEGASV